MRGEYVRLSHEIQVAVPTWIGRAGLWIFALLAFYSPLGVSLGGGLMLLALLLQWRDWRELARPSVILSLVFAVYAFARGWVAADASGAGLGRCDGPLDIPLALRGAQALVLRAAGE